MWGGWRCYSQTQNHWEGKYYYNRSWWVKDFYWRFEGIASSTSSHTNSKEQDRNQELESFDDSVPCVCLYCDICKKDVAS